MPARIQWPEEAGIHLCGGLLICLCLSVTLAQVFEMASGEALHSATIRSLLGQIVSFQLPIGIFIFFFLKANRKTLTETFGLRLGPVSKIAKYSILGAIISTAIAIAIHQVALRLLPALGLPAEEQVTVTELRQNTDLAYRALAAISATILAPIIEEGLFRGTIYSVIRGTNAPRKAALITSILFALAHANLATLLPLFFLSYALIHVYEKTGNLIVPIVVHMGFNLFNFIMLTLMTSRPTP